MAEGVSAANALAIATSPQIMKLALRTSLIIGSLLNLINQGDALFRAWRSERVQASFASTPTPHS